MELKAVFKIFQLRPGTIKNLHLGSLYRLESPKNQNSKVGPKNGLGSKGLNFFFFVNYVTVKCVLYRGFRYEKKNSSFHCGNTLWDFNFLKKNPPQSHLLLCTIGQKETEQKRYC